MHLLLRLLPLAALAQGWGKKDGACDAEGGAKALVAALKRGDFACASSVARNVDTTDLAVNEVLMELRSLEGRVKEIREALADDAGSDPSKALAPAHQWAQSGDEVFVTIKFAHKFDAPATLVNENDIDEVALEQDRVVVKAHKGTKHFALDLILLRDIDPANSTWVTASVGRMTLTLKKAAAQKEWWPRLNRDKAKPSNQGTWWDKQAEYDHEKDDVQKAEKADKPPRGLAEKLAARKKAGGEPVKESESLADKLELGDMPDAPPERAPLTEAVKRAEKRRQKAAKDAEQRKKDIAEEGRSKVTAAQARTKLDLEDEDKRLEFVYKQIEADVQKDAATPDFNPADVPETFPDVPEAEAFEKKMAKRAAKKDGDASPKKKKSKKKSKKTEL